MSRTVEQLRAWAIEEQHDKILDSIDQLEAWARPKMPPVKVGSFAGRNCYDGGGDEQE